MLQHTDDWFADPSAAETAEADISARRDAIRDLRRQSDALVADSIDDPTTVGIVRYAAASLAATDDAITTLLQRLHDGRSTAR